mmetsp:Transcript_37877/g.70568  ORF Transcript_37877/g.70568 Transcript_37877/m.70568 type:complete len:156 (+) Transcript_37877:181-648(+)
MTVCWFSLKEKINKKLRAHDPLLPSLTSVDNMLVIVMSYYFGVMPFLNIPDKIFGITLDPIPLERIQQNLPGAPGWVHKVLAFLLRGTPPSLLLTPVLFEHLKRRGIPVWVLGVNTVEHLKLAEHLGATGVLSDHPKWLCNAMKEERIKFGSISS